MFERDGLPVPAGMGAEGAAGAPAQLDQLPAGDGGRRQPLSRWVDGGAPPPSFELIDELAGDPPQIVRDEHGDAFGGIRMPELEVPVAMYRGSGEGDQLAELERLHHAVPDDELNRLYRDRADYHEQYATAVRRGVGGLLPRGADSIVAAAADRWGARFTS